MKLGGTGEEIVLVDIVWWATARVMGSKEKLARFEELVEVEHARPPQTGDRPASGGSTQTPAAPELSSQAAGALGDAVVSRSDAQ